MTSIFNTHYGDNLSRVNSRANEPKPERTELSKTNQPFARVLADLEHREPQNVANKPEQTAVLRPESKVPAEISVPEISNLTPGELNQEPTISKVPPTAVTFARLVKAYAEEPLCPGVKVGPMSVNPPALAKPEMNAPVVSPRPPAIKPPPAPQVLHIERRDEPATRVAANGKPPPAPDMLAANWAEDSEPAIVPELSELASTGNLLPSSFSPRPHDGIEEIQTIIEGAGRRHGIDPHLGMAIAHAESDFRVRATSQDGHHSKGLFQLLDSTGKDMMGHIGVSGPYQPYNPQQNALLGVGYLRRLHDIFSTETSLGSNMKTVPATSADDLEKIAIAAFNAGEGNVARAQAKARALGKDPSDFSAIEPFLPASTRSYVKKVSSLRNAYAQVETDKRRV